MLLEVPVDHVRVEDSQTDGVVVRQQQLVTEAVIDEFCDDLYAIANQHAQDIQEMAKVIVPEIVAVHDVLTPEQRATLAAKAKELRQNHHQHKGGFGGPGE